MARTKKTFLSQLLARFSKKKSRKSSNGFSLLAGDLRGRVTSFFSQNSKYLFILLVVVFFGVLGVLVAQRFKYLFLAGVVNGEYVTKSELTSRLVSSYGQEQWDAILTERVIRQEAKKRGISVTQDEKNARLKEFEDRLGGKELLESRLAQQGVTQSQFMSQIELEILVEKMFSDKGSFTEEELTAFWEENKYSLSTEATPSATPTDDARKQLSRSKIFEAAQEWLTDAKSKTKSEYYLGR